jgi:hypothetical protein
MKKVIFLIILSLIFIKCDDSGKKNILPLLGAEPQKQGTVILDDAGKVIITDGTIAEGSSIPIAEQGTLTEIGGGPTSEQTTDNSPGTGSNVKGEPSSGADESTTHPKEGEAGTSAADTTPANGKGVEQPPQIPDVDPVDDLSKNESQFAKYKINDSGGIYWIRELYQDGKAIFGWEFPPSFIVKVQSMEPGAKVLVTMYGVYPNKDTNVFYQYTAYQKPMKDIDIDESKWIVVGGKDFKYAYIEFHVMDEKGQDITSSTKAKINVHIGESALAAYLMKIKHNPSMTIIVITLLLTVIIVGANLVRRKYA